jgi:hypothetical protein
MSIKNSFFQSAAKTLAMGMLVLSASFNAAKAQDSKPAKTDFEKTPALDLKRFGTGHTLFGLHTYEPAYDLNQTPKPPFNAWLWGATLAYKITDPADKNRKMQYTAFAGAFRNSYFDVSPVAQVTGEIQNDGFFGGSFTLGGMYYKRMTFGTSQERMNKLLPLMMASVRFFKQDGPGNLYAGVVPSGLGKFIFVVSAKTNLGNLLSKKHKATKAQTSFAPSVGAVRTPEEEGGFDVDLSEIDLNDLHIYEESGADFEYFASEPSFN